MRLSTGLALSKLWTLVVRPPNSAITVFQTNCQIVALHPDGELLIVEGDSAAGPAKRARDSAWQAVLPLRGKVVNAGKGTKKAVLDNAEATALFTASWGGIGSDFDLESRRYDRLGPLADADVDGSHIRCLVLTLIYHYMFPLLENGHIYAAQPPTHALVIGQDKEFVTPKKNYPPERGIG